jgi:hypothetical protein
VNGQTGDVGILAIEAVWIDGERVALTPEESAEGIERLGDSIREWLAKRAEGASGDVAT